MCMCLSGAVIEDFLKTRHIGCDDCRVCGAEYRVRSYDHIDNNLH